MHASKIKTLLKSIQNLKKEIQKERFEKKDILLSLYCIFVQIH